MKKYGLNVRLSERTKNMSKADIKFIDREKQDIISICKKENIILNSSEKIKEMSVVNQIRLGLKYAKENKIQIYRVYIDLYISGGKWERKELMQMLDDFDKGFIEGFIFKDQKRFSRDYLLQEELINIYGKTKGADFRLIYGQEIFDNEFTRKINVVINEQTIIEGRKNAERLQQEKMEKGLPCIPAPFGYKYDKKKDLKNWKVVEKEAKIVRKIAKRYKTKNYKETIKELKIKKSLYYRIIKNIEKGIYHGNVVFDRKIKDLKGKIVKTERIEYKGNFEAILR